MFGQRASSQIVWSESPCTSFWTSKYEPSFDGARTFIHSGRRGRSATGSEVCKAPLSLCSAGLSTVATVKRTVQSVYRSEHTKEPHEPPFHESLGRPRHYLPRAVHGRPRCDDRERCPAVDRG